MKSIWIALLAMFISCPQASALVVGDSLPKELTEEIFPQQDVVYVVDFFAQWCVSCRIELPEVNALYHELKNNAQVQFVGVDVDEDVEVAKAFQQSLGLNFPIINDPSGRVIGSFEPMGMPALYYVINGEVKGLRLGALPHIDDVIRQDLQQLGVAL